MACFFGFATMAGCDTAGNTDNLNTNTVEEVQELDFCVSDNDCQRDSICVTLQDSTDKVCVLDRSDSVWPGDKCDILAGICDTGYECRKSQTHEGWFCVEVPEDVVEIPIVETPCPFEVVGNGFFFLSEQDYLVDVVTEYFPDSCELLMYQENNAQGWTWYNHFYIDDNDKVAVYNKWAEENQAKVELVYISYLRISLRMSSGAGNGGWVDNQTFQRKL